MIKKIVFSVIITAVLILSACQGQKRCPAYDRVDLIEAIDQPVQLLKLIK